MRKKINSIVLILTVILMTVSCKNKENPVPVSPTNNSPTQSAIIVAGSWKVSYYHESSDDKTSNFSGYAFVFNSNGTVAVTSSSGTTNGTWTSDDSNNEMHLSLGTNAPLKDLNHGWLITSKSSTEIVMKDDNTSHVEELHFTKI